MVCKNCGKYHPENTNFCDACGSDMRAQYADQINGQYSNPNGGYSQRNYPSAYPADPQAKSKIAAGLFGIFLGAFGVHNFYLGYTGKAVAQLLLTVLSCFFLSPISGIWGLIEGILILCDNINTDADGRPLRQ
jgi:TM2 domain-containing membrane protein YozV